MNGLCGVVEWQATPRNLCPTLKSTPKINIEALFARDDVGVSC